MLDAFKRSSAVADHGRDPVLRLRAPGPQGQAARADLRQARGRPALDRGRRPRADDGPARGADPGLLRHPGRPPLRGAGAHRVRAAAEAARADGRLARRRRRGARARLRQAARRRPRDRRQAPRPAERGRGPQRHRRRRGHARRSSSTTSSTPPARSRRSPRRSRPPAPARCSPPARTPCSPGHAIERIEKSPLAKLIVTDSIPLGPEKLKDAARSWSSRSRSSWSRAIKNIHEETSVTSLFV